MKANKLIPLMWILISLLFTIHITAQNIVGYEYGFDDDNPPTYVPITPTADFNLVTDIDVSSLPKDVNVFHIRFKDDIGQWSAIVSKIFVKPPDSYASASSIVGYEYGFDDDNPPTYVSISPTQDFNLLTDIDVSSLTNDVNVFHIRFKDDIGQWSAIVSKIFVKPPDSYASASSIVGYEYGFDDDNPPTYVSITPTQDFNLVTAIDVSSLTNDINVFHIRFKDDIGQWSSIISKIFVKPPQPLTYTNNVLVSYDYWFDDNTTSKITIPIDPAQADFVLAEIDVSQLWAGEHRINTQFKDEHGNYSVVLTDTINKTVLPIANYTTSEASICQGGWINFTNTSIDFDTVSWDFGDGQISLETNPTHIFETSGTFDVSLTVSDSSSGLDSTLTKSIEVYPTPINTVTISSNPTILTANQTGATYQWVDCNNEYAPILGETNQSFTPITTGRYAVEITLNGCSTMSNCNMITTLSNSDVSLDALVKLYPNPVKNSLFVKSELPLLVEIYNLSGVKISTLNLDLGNHEINLSDYSNGFYIVKVVDLSSVKNRQSIYKIIKD